MKDPQQVWQTLKNFDYPKNSRIFPIKEFIINTITMAPADYLIIISMVFFINVSP